MTKRTIIVNVNLLVLLIRTSPYMLLQSSRNVRLFNCCTYCLMQEFPCFLNECLEDFSTFERWSVIVSWSDVIVSKACKPDTIG